MDSYSTGEDQTLGGMSATTEDSASVTTEDTVSTGASTDSTLTDPSTTASEPVCGDAVIEGDEVCDDGNSDDGDGCEGDCKSRTLKQVATGGVHSCALWRSGEVKCWGRNDYGQLGYGNTNHIGDEEAPSSADPVSTGGSVVELAVGLYHSCALFEGGGVRCWGRNEYGQLGYGNVEDVGDNEEPSAVGHVGLGGPVEHLALGYGHTCALLEGGSVMCWGRGADGQLGYGNAENVGDDELPLSVGSVNLGGSAVQLASGANHTCALLETGTVRCWGANNYGQLGYGHTNNVGDGELPSSNSVVVGGAVKQLVLGTYHTCALLEGGAVRCWGGNHHGQLGHGTIEQIGDDEIPASVGDVILGEVAKQLVAGTSHTCALLEDGGLRCWGENANGQLGYGDISTIGDDELPSSVGPVFVGAVQQLGLGAQYTCAFLESGQERCWGWNKYGQLGYGHVETLGDEPGEMPPPPVPLF